MRIAERKKYGVVRSEYERCNAILACYQSNLSSKLIRIIFQFDNAKNIDCQGARNRYNHPTRGDSNPSIIHWLMIAND
jgi:hypothetical protein